MNFYCRKWRLYWAPKLLQPEVLRRWQVKIVGAVLKIFFLHLFFRDVINFFGVPETIAPFLIIQWES
ncbi:hypothetical protein DVR12_03655 [Chitinophaga silvatica]|uniref:Uncharacterized protein n=1 Tax=Chitinophaga silvatica TaxID=2282649 RepID=A0A3E1YHN4_9BACT|nr:hypothetical protein DVR12_03655 [Chitinophaga silvatica]